VHRNGYLYWVMKVVLTPVLAVIFRPRIEGRAHVPKSGPAVLACNHVSYLDWLLLPFAVRTRRISFLAKLEYFNDPGFRGRLKRYFFSSTGQVPVDRSGSAGASAALRTAQRLLLEGRLVGIFPEGTRSRDGRLHRARTGIARLAAETGVAVVPCATVGLYDAAPAGARFPRPRKVQVRFGTPMTFPSVEGRAPSALELRAWTDDLMAAVQALSGQDRSPADGIVSL
jgi:1-acyl-sn-glycerol-3-phosphate acyltransferase